MMKVRDLVCDVSLPVFKLNVVCRLSSRASTVGGPICDGLISYCILFQLAMNVK